MKLEQLGWNSVLSYHFDQLAEDGLVPARVIRSDRSVWRLAAEGGESEARLAGRFHNWDDAAQRPVVGDWVGASIQKDGFAIIRVVLPRSSQFSRKVAGDKTDEQIVAANIDVLFLINGLDGDYNPRRIERYVTLAWESGANPVVILNKIDLCNDVDSRVQEVEDIAHGVPVNAISAQFGLGLESLREYMGPGRTVALVGSSGTGKSTLVNRFLDSEYMKVQNVREDDSRGRHTTTHRELVVLPDGTLLIDTPGMRELQLWGGSDTLGASFAGIEELAGQCRFSDCRHESEPGCAVRRALQSGELDEDHYQNYCKLQAEYAYLQRRQDDNLARQYHRAITRIHRRIAKEHRSEKY